LKTEDDRIYFEHQITFTLGFDPPPQNRAKRRGTMTMTAIHAHGSVRPLDDYNYCV